MLSLARSRHTQLVRLGFTVSNSIGLFLGVWYKNKTPDLYPGSAHSIVGWFATAIAATQVSHILASPLTNLFNRLARRYKIKPVRYMLSPMQERLHSPEDHDDHQQISSDVESTQAPVEHPGISNSHLYQEDLHDSEFTSDDDTCFIGDSPSTRVPPHDHNGAFSKMFSASLLSQMRRLILLIYDVIDRVILVIAFAAFCTGIATFWGLFVSPDVSMMTVQRRVNLTVTS